jgi:hypothetical protein
MCCWNECEIEAVCEEGVGESVTSLPDAVPTVEPALRDFAAPSRRRIEDVTAVFARIRRLEYC